MDDDYFLVIFIILKKWRQKLLFLPIGVYLFFDPSSFPFDKPDDEPDDPVEEPPDSPTAPCIDPLDRPADEPIDAFVITCIKPFRTPIINPEESDPPPPPSSHYFKLKSIFSNAFFPTYMCMIADCL